MYVLIDSTKTISSMILKNSVILFLVAGSVLVKFLPPAKYEVNKPS